MNLLSTCCPRFTIIPEEFQRPEAKLIRNAVLHWLGLLASPVLFILNRTDFLSCRNQKLSAVFYFSEKI